MVPFDEKVCRLIKKWLGKQKMSFFRKQLTFSTPKTHLPPVKGLNKLSSIFHADRFPSTTEHAMQVH